MDVALAPGHSIAEGYNEGLYARELKFPSSLTTNKAKYWLVGWEEIELTGTQVRDQGVVTCNRS
jgi:ribosome modulation factor